MTRNERRKAAKKRLEAKQERFLGRVEAQRLENVREIVKSNLNSPIERSGLSLDKTGALSGGYGYGLRSCLSGMKEQSHRPYICRAGGQMNRSRAMALALKPVNQRGDRYVKVLTGDRSQWPVVEK